jgi:hypothetical protein
VQEVIEDDTATVLPLKENEMEGRRTELTKTEMLLLRACKTSDPEKRLTSVYKRFYLAGVPEHRDICSILSSLLFKIIGTMDKRMFNDIMDHSTTRSYMVGGNDHMTPNRTAMYNQHWFNRKRALMSELELLPAEIIHDNTNHISPSRFSR